VGEQKKFKAIMMRHSDTKVASVIETLGGGLDGAFGGVYNSFRYILRLSASYNAQGQAENLGTLEDLRGFFALQPGDPETNTIVLTDHYGVTHNVWFLGECAPEPLTTIITGNYAHFTVPVEFREIPS
jgi:hypothetical protein